MLKVLVADSSPESRAVYRSILSPHFEVQEADSVRAAFDLCRTDWPDLVLLDEELVELCSLVRRLPALRALPLIMIAIPGNEGAGWGARVRCLASGADDALDRAFHPEELIFRIRARLREFHRLQEEESVLVVGNLTLEPASRQARIEGRFVELTPTELELLRYFAKRVGRIVPRRQLLAELWADSVVSRRTVDTHLANLRRKLRRFDHGFETIYGAGYRLVPLREDTGEVSSPRQ